jgi:diguanylate cyclase (GGDEF)-like protein
VTARSPRSEASEARAAIAAIWEKSRDDVLARVTMLEEAVAALMENRLTEAERRSAERDAHRLAGSAGTFGFVRASQSERKMEWIFAGPDPNTPDKVLTAAEEVVVLRTDLDSATTPAAVHEPAISPGKHQRRPRLLTALGDRTHADEISALAAGRGFEVISTMDPGDPLLGGDRYVAAVVDLGLPAGSGQRLIAKLMSSDPPVPTLALTPSDTFPDRVEAARLGARGLLSNAAPPDEVLGAVEGLLTRTRVADTSVLVVDDDRAVLDAVCAVLQSGGLRTIGLEDPTEFWATLEELRPDLLVLDLDMPQISGKELCRVVRNDPHWAGLPILFLTAHSGPETVEALFAAGADDFVTKPFAGPELLARVGNRLERARLLRALAEDDPLTGLANRRRAEADLRLLLGLADRHNQAFSIAMVDLDQFKRVNDRHGHAMGDIVLRRVGTLLRGSFRREDVVARWGGEEFLLGMYGMSTDDAVQHIASILETLREERFVTPSGPPLSVTFSAGVASYPQDGATVEALCAAADQTLYRAKRHGRDRVLTAAVADSLNEADIVMVEDDEALAELLRHALTTRGYRFRHFVDGREAAEHLAGSSARLDARVVLLDVDLPTLNGFGVLRQMAAAGVLTNTRVIMLTARSGEKEVVEALELGAFDHVAKPFSVPVLMQRIRKALGS